MLVLAVTLVLSPAALADASAAEWRAVKSLLEMRRENVIVQNFDLSCGAAALATLLTYQHGDPVSEREVAEGLIRREEYLAGPEVVRRRQGFSLLDLKRYVGQRGYKGVGYGGLGFEDLVELAPILVPVNFNGYNHFVIFRGLAGDVAVLADPAWGNRTMPVAAFEDAWLEYPEFGKVGFVVARRDGAAPPGGLALRPDDLLQTPPAALRRVLSPVRP